MNVSNFVQFILENWDVSVLDQNNISYIELNNRAKNFKMNCPKNSEKDLSYLFIDINNEDPIFFILSNNQSNVIRNLFKTFDLEDFEPIEDSDSFGIHLFNFRSI